MEYTVLVWECPKGDSLLPRVPMRAEEKTRLPPDSESNVLDRPLSPPTGLNPKGHQDTHQSPPLGRCLSEARMRYNDFKPGEAPSRQRVGALVQLQTSPRSARRAAGKAARSAEPV